MLVAVQDDYVDRFVGNPTNGYLAWLRALRLRSMHLVFGAMGLPAPANAEQLSVKRQFEALSKCNAAFPGADEMLGELTRQGYSLHMASGQESEYLRGGLSGSGLTHYFGRLFGPDLVDCAKEGTEYYSRVFDAIGVRSNEVIIVDDYPPAIGWAVASGAQVVQVKLSPLIRHPTQPGIAAVVTSLYDLPEQIARIAANLRLG
ncbi:MAG: putative phosphatase [Chthonomonadaceae bacterium]|nr:putative phosphatase [Chthonomonadaceae bacterium]